MKYAFLKPDRENLLIKQGYELVVGIDEVGRGSWAGPLYLCAYIYSMSEKWVEGIRDSKQLSKAKRESLIRQFEKESYVLKIILNKQIDEVGLGNAMNKALKELILEIKGKCKGRKILIIIDGYFKGDWGDNVVFEAKADRNIYSVACASVIAKVLRDNEMSRIAKLYPEYDFDLNVGYGTQRHIEALQKCGTCEIHRKSYKPVKEIVLKLEAKK